MNFKLLSHLLVLICLNACGVKSDPIPPAGTQLPSYVDKFLDDPKKNNDKKKEENKNEKKARP